ncbi:MAG: CPBP family intramembrane metalloprotease [Gemmatimonadales bacterium]|nr:CPBP family intramembrane metalloprotease [Gemmatimonadales bacterium]MYL05416.1 CPBP family intramembrane metalloprotease [Gemmatimonadales bacterium]
MNVKPEGWAWAGRLAAFAGLFIAFGLVFGFATALIAGLPGTEAAESVDWRTVTPVLLAACAATWLLAVGVDRRPLSALGLRPGPPGLAELGSGVLAGVAIIGAAILALVAPGWVSWTVTPAPVLEGVQVSALLLVAAFTEELLFRGYPFRVLHVRFGPVPAVVATSVAFGLVHGANPGVTPLALVNLTLAGVLLGVAYWRSGSLWFVTGLHFGWNWVMAASGLPVSGLDVSVSGLEAAVTGPVLWTGGAFGPEGALMITFVTVLGTAWLWRVAGSRSSSGSRLSTTTGSPDDNDGSLDASG